MQSLSIFDYYYYIKDKLHPVIWNFDSQDVSSSKFISKVNSISIRDYIFIRTSKDINIGEIIHTTGILDFINKYPDEKVFSIAPPYKWNKLYLATFIEGKLTKIYKNTYNSLNEIKVYRCTNNPKLISFCNSLDMFWAPDYPIVCFIGLTYRNELKVIGFKSLSRLSTLI
jgi:hypothetical protein